MKKYRRVWFLKVVCDKLHLRKTYDFFLMNQIGELPVIYIKKKIRMSNTTTLEEQQPKIKRLNKHTVPLHGCLF
jgi:hypothetical protein